MEAGYEVVEHGGSLKNSFCRTVVVAGWDSRQQEERVAIDLEDLDRIAVREIAMKAFDVFLPDKVALGHLEEVYTYLTAEALQVADCPGDLEMVGGN